MAIRVSTSGRILHIVGPAQEIMDRLVSERLDNADSIKSFYDSGTTSLTTCVAVRV